MKVCLLLIKYVAKIGIYPVEPHKSIFNRQNIGVLLIFGQTIASVTAYLLFGAKAIREYEECFFIWVSLIGTTVGFLGTIQKTVLIFQLIDHVNEFIEIQSEDPISRCVHEKTIEKIEMLTRIVHFLFVKVLFPFTLIPFVAISYYLYYTTDKGPDAFIVLNALELPFDNRTPIGYAVSVLMVTGTFYVVCYTVTCALCLLITIYMVAMSITTECQKKLQAMNEINDDVVKMINVVRLLYSFHAGAKEITAEFNEVMEMIITVVYMFSMLSISDTLLMCHAAKNIQDLFLPTIFTIASFVIIFVFCELGQRIIDQSMEGYYDIVLSDWYRFPLPLQKVYPLFISGASNPITINGMGNIACTREAFKNVCAKVYSCFTALRQV